MAQTLHLQIEAEAVRVDVLKTALEKKQGEMLTYADSLHAELKEKLGNPDEDLKPMLTMEDEQFQHYLKLQADKINQWKADALSAVGRQRDSIATKLKVG